MPKPYNPELFERTVGGDPMENRYDTDITLLDLFAAAALMGICSNVQYDPTLYESRAIQAFDHAHAMLAEREKLETKHD